MTVFFLILLLVVGYNSCDLSKNNIIDVILKDHYQRIYYSTGKENFKQYIKRAEKAIVEGNSDIVRCVENLRVYGGYGGGGDYSSYEYCAWSLQQGLLLPIK